jgi:hypothetical protein
MIYHKRFLNCLTDWQICLMISGGEPFASTQWIDKQDDFIDKQSDFHSL